jgi:hypothetical protein
MAYLATANDVKTAALYRAGEPTDGTSQYDGLAYAWMTDVLRAVISGGQFGPSPLEPVDWLWARAWPRGALQMVQPCNGNPPRTTYAAFQTGSQTVTTTPMIPGQPNLAGWRLQQDQTPARHLIGVAQHDPAGNHSTLTLQEPWTGSQLYTTAWLAYPDTYELPVDFVRGTSPLYISAYPNFGMPYVIDVLDTPDLERYAPQPWPMTTGRTFGGLPVVAARVDERKLRFSHYLYTPDTPLPVQIEFEYIRCPEVLAEGSIPPIPMQHRILLVFGLAYLILVDKDDGSNQALYGQFQAQVKAMTDEYRRTLRRMSNRWGVVQPSRVTGTYGPPRWTTGGLPAWNW